MINLTTGPVKLREEVSKSLSKKAISHRAPKFKSLHKEFVNRMQTQLNIKDVIVLQGSGTLANEAMIWQIKTNGSKGLILSNGEFGSRLIKQANRVDLDFISHEINWGNTFKLKQIERLIDSENLQWILFTHCETSTGIMNPLVELKQLAKNKGIACFVDCMSTIGTMKVDLSDVSMASCSSGKGLCSISGLAFIFSNIKFSQHENIPRYFDLSLYVEKNGIPFTLSSVQLNAVNISSRKVMDQKTWSQNQEHSQKIYNALHPLGIIPFNTINSRVFTIIQDKNSVELCDRLSECGVQLSYQSDYLIKRNWFQLALFSNHSANKIDTVIQKIIKEL